MTATAAPKLLTRMAKASSFDAKSRSAEVVVSTGRDAGDGFLLVHTREAIRWPQRPIPLTIDHGRSVRDVAGAVVRLELGEVDGVPALLGRIELHESGEAAELVERLLQSSAARFSVGARCHRIEAPLERGGPDRVTDWEPIELACVVVGQDGAAILRSFQSSEDMTVSPATRPTEGDNQEPSRDELKRMRIENKILRAAQRANYPADKIDGLIERSATLEDGLRTILEWKTEQAGGNGFPVNMHPGISGVILPGSGPADDSTLARILDAKMGVKGAEADYRNIPLRRVLEELSLARGGGTLRNLSPHKVLERAWSSSDFATALTDSSERILLNAYEEADQGVRALARRLTLTDFRTTKLLRLSQFGTVTAVAEGGEYPAQPFSEEDAASLTAKQYGGIAPLTRVAVANDDLEIFSRLVVEMGRAAARAEMDELAARLADISWDASNSLSGQSNLDLTAISNAVVLLRRQTGVNGEAIAFRPDVLVVAPEQETAARQLVGSYSPATAGDVMPYALRVEVDHHLADGTAYLADTRYSPLALGMIGSGPTLTSEEKFTTGGVMFKVAHDFGTCAVDGRSIVKIAL